jgi:hypothetical protein
MAWRVDKEQVLLCLACAMALRRALHVVGANGWPLAAYQPILRRLGEQHGYSPGGSEVGDAARGENWSIAIETIIDDMAKR